MEEGKTIYMFMVDEKYQYCMYQIRDLLNDNEIGTLQTLDEPLLKLKKSKYPEDISFISIDSNIFMIGGCCENGISSKKVFIYDTLSSNLVKGPKLNSGKFLPYIFTRGSNIFVLSRLMYCLSHNPALEDEPRFEMLDTDNLQSRWCPLLLPLFELSIHRYLYSISAATIISIGDDTWIVIAIENLATYAYNVYKREWIYVSDELLPFKDHGLSIPHFPSMCYAYSLKSRRFSAFHFRYASNEVKHLFEIDEIYMNDYVIPPLYPQLACIRSLPMIFAPGGQAYHIITGVDEPESSYSVGGNCYVKIYAYEFSDPKLEGHSSKRVGKKKKQIRYDEGQGDLDEKTWLKRCKNEAKGQSSKKTKTGKMRQKEEKGFDLTILWHMCYLGGPLCDPYTHVAGAVAM